MQRLSVDFHQEFCYTLLSFHKLGRSVMKRSVLRVLLIAGLFMVVLISSNITIAQELTTIQLPKPKTEGGMPLLDVLMKRQSVREYSTKPLSEQILSNLLWAAFGITRPESGKRTAPSAHNWQEIDIYVAMEKGLYLYDFKDHVLRPVLAKDIREVTGRQPFVKDAPVNLIFVADYNRMGDSPTTEKEKYSTVDTGFISQNVYLFCTSEGLATVVRGLVDREALAKAMHLESHQKVTYAQTVGYPK